MMVCGGFFSKSAFVCALPQADNNNGIYVDTYNNRRKWDLYINTYTKVK